MFHEKRLLMYGGSNTALGMNNKFKRLFSNSANVDSISQFLFDNNAHSRTSIKLLLPSVYENQSQIPLLIEGRFWDLQNQESDTKKTILHIIMNIYFYLFRIRLKRDNFGFLTFLHIFECNFELKKLMYCNGFVTNRIKTAAALVIV